MSERTMIGHLRQLVGNVLAPGADASVRASYARTASETAHDLLDSYRAGRLTLEGGQLRDIIVVKAGHRDAGDARVRIEQREALEELRDFDNFTGLQPTHVVNDGADGYGPVPLIRSIARPWTSGFTGGAPVIPDFTTSGPFAEVDPTLPMDDDEGGVAIVNAAAVDGRHWSMLYVETSRQVLDFAGREGNALLDEILRDEVDLAAEKFVAGELVAAAGGTHAAGADLGAALDDAESAAGGRGPVPLVVVNAIDWPTVRRALPATFFDGPHPRAVVSAGQPVGTATFVGAGALLLYAAQIMATDAVQPRGFSKGVGLARPFYFGLRGMVEEGVELVSPEVQTVTGIGA